MSEPLYEAETWYGANGWRWQTYKDGKAFCRSATTLTTTSREKALEQARADMEWDRNSGRVRVTLSPETPPKEPAEPDRYVIIRPRKGVSAERVRDWLEGNFQQPGEVDNGSGTADARRWISYGNPLVNAHIEIREG